MSNDSLWQKIEADFQVAINDLPERNPANRAGQINFQQKHTWLKPPLPCVYPG